MEGQSERPTVADIDGGVGENWELERDCPVWSAQQEGLVRW